MSLAVSRSVLKAPSLFISNSRLTYCNIQLLCPSSCARTTPVLINQTGSLFWIEDIWLVVVFLSRVYISKCIDSIGSHCSCQNLTGFHCSEPTTGATRSFIVFSVTSDTRDTRAARPSHLLNDSQMTPLNIWLTISTNQTLSVVPLDQSNT